MRFLSLAAAAALLLAVPASSAPKATGPASNAVLVIGALHDLHPREPGFGYADLRSAILAFRPDILVLEVRPDELSGKKETPGRPEYPAVIWPLLTSLNAQTVAMEPGGETFKALSSGAGAAFAAMRQRDPEGAAALARLETAMDDSLLSYWGSAGQVQDATTAALAGGLQALQLGLVGPSYAIVQAQWNRHMADRVRQTVAANPNKRVLVLGSYKNRAMLEEAVRHTAAGRLIDAQQWLDTLPAASPAALTPRS